ncbi:MAG: hypothetical protein N3A57_06370 [Negativicutes bacterium]|nr:hypothetical protein [Negativicutes bacterium]
MFKYHCDQFDKLVLITFRKPDSAENLLALHNSLNSWRNVLPGARIVVVGCRGASEFSDGRMVFDECLPSWCDERQPMWMPELLEIPQKNHPARFYCLLNPDIIITSSVARAVSVLMDAYRDSSKKMLAIGRRINLTVREKLEFDNDWEFRLGKAVAERGNDEGFCAIDFHLFTAGLFCELPAIYCRHGTDQVLIYSALSDNADVVDISDQACIIHQVHAPGYGSLDPFADEVSRHSYEMISHLDGYNYFNATHYLTDRGEILRLPSIEYRIKTLTQKIIELAGSRPIAIWGTGGTGRSLADILLFHGGNLSCFYDNDRARQGDKYRGIETRKPVDIREFIVVASSFYPEIKRQLENMELTEGADFIGLYHFPGRIRVNFASLKL